nr:hypothetical protein [Tanacetum cinerariifolium]
MSAMENTTPLMTTVTKPTTNPRDADANPRVNIQEFCEEYYEDILLIIMDKVRRDLRKDVHTRDHPWGRIHPHSLDTLKKGRPKDKERLRDVGESYDDSFSHSYHDGNRSRHIKRRKDNESLLSSMPRSDSSDGRYQRSKRVNNLELIKRLNEHVPKTMEEMMITTTAFIQGEASAASKKKGHVSRKAHDRSKRQNSDKRSNFRGHSREGRGSNRFTPLTRTPKEILVVEAGKLSHLIKEIKQRWDQSKKRKKETTVKDKPMKIYMIQSWQRTTRQKVTQSFERVKEITFPPLPASSETEGPLVIEAKIGEDMIYRMTGEYPSRMLSQCSTTDRGTPVMSDGFHVLNSSKDFSADLERNLFRLANFPIRLGTSLIVRSDGCCSTATVLSGHGFIPSRVTTYPKNISSANPNA